MQDKQHYLDDEIDFYELFSTLWVERKLIALITAIAILISIAYTLMLKDVYRAEAVLISAEEQQSTGGLASQYGGTAALLGINIGAGGNDKVNKAIAVMKSREFIWRFIETHDLLVPLFAGTWDPVNRLSQIDNSVYDSASDHWFLAGGKPTQLEAFREFSETLSISGPDRDTGIITVAIDWHDPQLASEWVNKFVSDINATIKQRDVEEATSAIAYLREQLGAVQLVEMQRVFYQLIESQTRITMLADVRDEYVFQVIDPAVVPDKKLSPSREIIVAISAIIALILAIGIVLLRQSFMSNKRPAA